MIGPLGEMEASHWSILQNGGFSLVKIEKDCASLHRSWHKSKRSALAGVAGVEMMELMLNAFTSSTVIGQSLNMESSHWSTSRKVIASKLAQARSELAGVEMMD